MKPTVEQSIWLLRVVGRGNLCLIPHQLEFYQTHFVGVSLARNWRPPPFEVSGKTLKLRDFIGLVQSAPAVSDRAREVLELICGDALEFLPLGRIRKKHYYVMNVLKRENVVDVARSTVARYSGSEAVTSVERVEFLIGLPQKLPPVFKDSCAPGEIFVTRPFAEAVVKHGLTGLALADPSQDNFGKLVRGEDLNVVAGVMP